MKTHININEKSPISILSNSLKNTKLNFLKNNKLFISIALVSTISATSSISLNSFISESLINNIWATTNTEFTQSNFNETLSENTKITQSQNKPAIINEINFWDKEQPDYLTQFKSKLINDVSYYKKKNIISLDPLYELVLLPNEPKNYINEQHMIKKATNKFFNLFFPVLSQEKAMTNFSSSAIVKIPNQYSNDEASKSMTKNSNCKITIVHKGTGGMISFDALDKDGLNKLNLNNKSEPILKTNLQYSKEETEIFQEFVFLHEYFHCVYETSDKKLTLQNSLYGFSEIPEAQKLSNYLYSDIILRKSDKEIWSHFKPDYIERNSEKYVDILAMITLINRYSNQSTPEQLKSLNTILNDMSSFRTSSQLFSPNTSHNGYEIFSYLSQTSNIEKISKFSSFQEIENFANETIDLSNSWRTLNNRNRNFSDFILVNHIDSMVHSLLNVITKDSDFSKQNLNKYLIQKNGTNKTDNFSEDLIDAVIDEIFLRSQNKSTLKEDIKKINADDTSFISEQYYHLFNLITNKLISEKPYTVNLNLLVDTLKYFQEHKDSPEIKKLTTPSTENLLKLQIKLFTLNDNFSNSLDLFLEKNPTSVKNINDLFGKYYFSYDYYKKQVNNTSYTPDLTGNHSLILTNNFRTQFWANKYSIKNYSLESPSDNDISTVSKRLIVPDYDLEVPTLVYLNKKIDVKINNLKEQSINDPKPSVSYTFNIDNFHKIQKNNNHFNQNEKNLEVKKNKY